MSSGVGLEPEQVWEDAALEATPYGKKDPAQASIGFAPGHPAGSASPLTWAQAQLVRLALAVGAGRPLEQPAITRARYVDAPPPGTAPLSAALSTSGALLTVTGRTTPGANVDLAITDTGAASASTTVASVHSLVYLARNHRQMPTGVHPLLCRQRPGRHAWVDDGRRLEAGDRPSRRAGCVDGAVHRRRAHHALGPARTRRSRLGGRGRG
jgi:hypothetical protein